MKIRMKHDWCGNLNYSPKAGDILEVIDTVCDHEEFFWVAKHNGEEFDIFPYEAEEYQEPRKEKNDGKS